MRLEDLRLPHRHEDWRWTDLSAIGPALAAKPANDTAPDISDWLVDGVDGPVVVFVNGRLDEGASRLGSVRVEAAAPAENAAPLARIAARQSRARLIVGAGPRVQIVHVASGGQAHLDFSYEVAAGETARVVETYVGGGAAWTNVRVTARLGQGAKLRRAARLLQSGGAWTESVDAELGPRADYASVSLIACAAAVRSEYEVRLAGADGRAHVDGTMVAGGRQHFDVVGRVRHLGTGGTSGQTWRSVAAGKASASFSGRIEVERGAQKTDAREDVKALLLDRTASVNAKPELEIFADDVKCAHGATVGELDKRALFYLESRGVPPDLARTLLTEAFVADAFEAVANAELRAVLGADARGALEDVR